MKQLLIVALLAAPLLAQTTGPGGRIHITTRTVAMVEQLEQTLMTAAQKRDTATLDHMLGDDFSVTRPGDEPLGRDEWLKSSPRSFRTGDLNARDLDTVVIANFLLTEEFALGTKNYFVVDVWQKTGENWQLVSRYQSPTSKTVPKNRKPTGKE